MGRHATPAGTLRAARITRLAALILFWLAGLVVGFFGLLSVGARFGCSSNARGLACRPAGTALGVVLVVAVIAVVTAVTLATDARYDRIGRPIGWLAAVVVVGIALLAGCYFGARALLNTA